MNYDPTTLRSLLVTKSFMFSVGLPTLECLQGLALHK
jgi:hypothetical protein